MTEHIGYIVNSGAWSLGGLAVGFYLGRLKRDIDELKGKVERNDSNEGQ